MVVIRELEKQDLESVVTLFLSVFSQEPWNDNWPTVGRAKQYLEDITNTPGYKGFVIRKNSDYVGAVLGHVVKWWSGDEFFIKELFVANEHQGQGIGSKLLEHLKVALKEENIKAIVLLTEAGVPAFQFYKGKGFTRSEDTIFMYNNIK